MISRKLLLLMLGIPLLLGPSGCVGHGAEDALAAANRSNLQRLTNLYAAFQSRHDWRGPTDESEFKAFLQGWNRAKLTAIGVDPSELDQVFVSSRDGQPFKIRYGIPGNMMGSDAAVVFEATGIDGRRMVGMLNMSQREVGDDEYQRLWQDATSHSPAGSSR